MSPKGPEKIAQPWVQILFRISGRKNPGFQKHNKPSDIHFKRIMASIIGCPKIIYNLCPAKTKTKKL